MCELEMMLRLESGYWKAGGAIQRGLYEGRISSRVANDWSSLGYSDTQERRLGRDVLRAWHQGGH